MSSNKRNTGLKPFTIISGEPRKIDCYLDDLSLTLYWAKSKDDILEHLLRTKDPELQNIPLSYCNSHSPSPQHLVLCDKESCPCSKYVNCLHCDCTKEAVPKGGVTIEFDGMKETLAYREIDGEAAYCKCIKPQYKGKLELCQDAIYNVEDDSDYCYKIIELHIAESIQVHADDNDSNGEPIKKASKHSHSGGESV